MPVALASAASLAPSHVSPDALHGARTLALARASTPSLCRVRSLQLNGYWLANVPRARECPAYKLASAARIELWRFAAKLERREHGFRLLRLHARLGRYQTSRLSLRTAQPDLTPGPQGQSDTSPSKRQNSATKKHWRQTANDSQTAARRISPDSPAFRPLHSANAIRFGKLTCGTHLGGTLSLRFDGTQTGETGRTARTRPTRIVVSTASFRFGYASRSCEAGPTQKLADLTPQTIPV